MERFFSAAFAIFLAAPATMALPLIQSPAEARTNRVSPGAHISLRVEATSTTSPTLSYQWRFGTEDIPGATNAVLIMDAIQTNQAGTYVVNVSDAEGTSTSPAWIVLIAPTFAKITNQPFSRAGAQAIVLGDYNGDGRIDVYCTARSSATTTLFLNTGDGSFAPAPGTVGAKLVNPVGGTWADYDNDGALDLFISNNNGGNDSLLRNNGDGFTAITTGRIVSSGGNGNGCAWADYDRDGLLDLYVANSNENNFLFRGETNGTFTRITTGPAVTGTGGSQGCAWIDYDNDGYPDLYATGVPNLLFHNNGNGTFSKVPATSFAAGTGGLGFAWGDYDNDGWPDLIAAIGGIALYHNNGNGTFTKLPSPLAADPGSFATVNWIDADSDGWLDLFATDFASTASKCRLYHNNGDGTFTRVSGSPLFADGGRSFAAAWGDINNDGFPDVLVSYINAPNVIHRNDGNDNHWLTMRCLGRVSNRSAVGAKVRIEATIFGRTFWQVREISTGGNIGDQNQMDPMFGLGDAAIVRQLIVEWPSGTRQELRNVAANQILTLREPAMLGLVSEAGARRVNLRGGKNIVYDLEQSSDLRTWTAWTSITNNLGANGAEITLIDDAYQPMRAYRAVER
jgi:hypothetical protein